ncbi:MAG: DNA cytosine methyltransferase [Prevotellaceae bacterium]|jgi:site-specific DNA-cytosine methylase|nr:DNA cytosine methyltransferase [Prevotellaceae bacterium]
MKSQQLDIRFPKLEYTFADFFAGAGGFSLGLMQAGMKCIAALENDADSLHTYWSNLCLKGWSHLWISKERAGDKKFVKKLGSGETMNRLFDIPSDDWLSKTEQVSPCLNLFGYDINQIEPEQFMKMCCVRPGDIRVFVGGPPCQGFSTSNHFRNEEDERNRLPLRMIYFAKVCRPDYVFLENVPGLLTVGRKGRNSESPFVLWIRESFEEAGYDMTYHVHNAADYGVPQNRKRLIFSANRKGVKPFEFPHPTHGNTENLQPYVTVREAIFGLPPLKSGETYEGEPYGYDPIEGHVICPSCLNYNQKERQQCHYCKSELTGAITGGVFKYPKAGLTLIDTKARMNPERKGIYS